MSAMSRTHLGPGAPVPGPGSMPVQARACALLNDQPQARTHTKEYDTVYKGQNALQCIERTTRVMLEKQAVVSKRASNLLQTSSALGYISCKECYCCSANDAGLPGSL